MSLWVPFEEEPLWDGLRAIFGLTVKSEEKYIAMYFSMKAIRVLARTLN